VGRDRFDGSVAILCGGVGAARFLQGLRQVMSDGGITAIVNVADDLVLHGLRISPDIDTIVYTLAGAGSRERGWGLEGETWQAMDMVRHYGGVDWFSLGDRDLGTHLFRTERLSQGALLNEVTAELAAAWGLGLAVLPASNDRIQTMITTVDEGEIPFQEYFVRRRHDVTVTSVRFAGADGARPGPGVLEALEQADVVVIAPSNPVVSIDPILAIDGVWPILEARRSSVVAVSPIVGGKALKGPADRMLAELGHEASVAGIAGWYRSIAGTLVIDEVDADQAPAVESLGLSSVVTDTIMSEPRRAADLARTTILAPTGRR
jgi:LPPG:FO 2-phospho-L-lactate transferase